MDQPSRWRWARNGALVGFAIAVSDILVKWRGQVYLPSWSGDALVENVSHLLSSIFFTGLIGFVLGSLRDRNLSQGQTSQAGTFNETSQTRQVRCQNCGTLNRVLSDASGRVQKCGNCGEQFLLGAADGRYAKRSHSVRQLLAFMKPIVKYVFLFLFFGIGVAFSIGTITEMRDPYGSGAWMLGMFGAMFLLMRNPIR